MPLPFKAPASSALVNSKYVYKTIDDVKVGKLSFYKVSSSETGAINDIQEYLNQVADTTGQIFENDPNRKNYSSNNFIANGDNRKQAIEKLDLAAKFNLDEINSLNNEFFNYINNGSFLIRGYISDNAYETANGSPIGGEIYYNQSTGFIRYYNGVDEKWDDVGKQVLGVQETPIGVVNGLNTTFDIANMPINDEALSVFLNGVLVSKDAYTFSAPTITFNTAPSLGQRVYVTYLSDGNPATPVISAGTNNVFYHVVSAGELIAKEFALPSAPATPTHLLVDVIGGTALEFGSDFTVSGANLSWNGLGLDGIITSGDRLRIQYFN